MASEFVCKRCGQPVGHWYYGWKHQTGWHSGKTCGQKPIPVRRETKKGGQHAAR